MLTQEEVDKKVREEILPDPQHPLHASVKPFADQLDEMLRTSMVMQLTPEGAKQQSAKRDYLRKQIFNVVNELPIEPFVPMPTKTVTAETKSRMEAARVAETRIKENRSAWMRWLAAAAVLGVAGGAAWAYFGKKKA